MNAFVAKNYKFLIVCLLIGAVAGLLWLGNFGYHFGELVFKPTADLRVDETAAFFAIMFGLLGIFVGFVIAFIIEVFSFYTYHLLKKCYPKEQG